jgi:Lon-like ATP-dependent protease
VPIRQDTAMTGSLSIKGEVLPVGAVTAKVEAAIEAGIKRVIVPKANLGDVILNDTDAKKIKIIPVKNIVNVLEHAMVWKGKEKILKKIKQ